MPRNTQLKHTVERSPSRSRNRKHSKIKKYIFVNKSHRFPITKPYLCQLKVWAYGDRRKSQRFHSSLSILSKHFHAAVPTCNQPFFFSTFIVSLSYFSCSFQSLVAVKKVPCCQFSGSRRLLLLPLGRPRQCNQRNGECAHLGHLVVVDAWNLTVHETQMKIIT